MDEVYNNAKLGLTRLLSTLDAENRQVLGLTPAEEDETPTFSAYLRCEWPLRSERPLLQDTAQQTAGLLTPVAAVGSW